MLKALARLFRSSSPDESRRKKPAKKKKVVSSKQPPYAGVEIKAGKNCCTEVKELLGKRFLTSEAPLVPLKDCTSAVCKCRYIQYQDRRDDLRRDTDAGLTGRFHTGSDRRKGSRGRRKSDY